MIRACLAAIVLCGVLVAAPVTAAAQGITVGLFAPTAPFESSGDRVSFINALAEHLASAAAGVKVTGKVYSTAAAFTAAVRKGEIQFAVIDAPYAAANALPYSILAAATRHGGASAPWQLIAKSSINSIRNLRDAKVAIPSVGAKAHSFVANALLGGEIEASYFASVTEAADPRSALAMITVGRVEAAFVPAGLEPPAGTKRIATLATVGWPMFVALPSADAKRTSAFAARVKSYSGSGTFTGFTDAAAANYRGLTTMFGKPAKKGPMALPPPARLNVRDVLAGRAFAIPLSNPLVLVEAPQASESK
jgi:hypothetical protein